MLKQIASFCKGAYYTARTEEGTRTGEQVDKKRGAPGGAAVPAAAQYCQTPPRRDYPGGKPSA